MLLILKIGGKLLITFSSIQGEIFLWIHTVVIWAETISISYHGLPFVFPVMATLSIAPDSTVFFANLRHLVTTVLNFWPPKNKMAYKSTNVPEVHGNIASYPLKMHYGFVWVFWSNTKHSTDASKSKDLRKVPAPQFTKVEGSLVSSVAWNFMWAIYYRICIYY